MSAPITFEDRLRVAANCAVRYPPGSVCTVRQQDLSDALAMIAALKDANAMRAEIIAKLIQDAAAQEPPVDRRPAILAELAALPVVRYVGFEAEQEPSC